MSINKIKYILQFADNALVLGQRLGEWCGHGPVLEQDIALTNTALDHIGQARSFYQLAADLINELPEHEQQELFKSPALLEKKSNFTEDDLAYLRDAWDFRNVLLLEQPNGDWADTIARSFFYDHFAALVYNELAQKSEDLQLKAIAEKSLKEVTYHKRWSSEWVIRLGDGTEESHQRMQKAISNLWPFTGELFELSKVEKSLSAEAWNVIQLTDLKLIWEKEITEILEQATLDIPDPKEWMHTGGKEGLHSEHLGYILAEMQYIQRTYPNMEW